MAGQQPAPSPIVWNNVDDDGPSVAVVNLGKQYWLEQPLAPTLQHSLMAMLRRVGAKPFWALRNVSFEIAAGESVGIIGANGAGKSTLLRLICGLGRPTTGDVQIRGRVAALLQLGAGFNPHLTGRDNLMVAGVLGGLRRREVAALFDDIVEFAELWDFIEQPLLTYSSGMQMRLAFSVAIHVDPALLIIDEALAVGDAHFAKKCLDRIERFKRAGKTLIMVSHDMDAIRTFCDRAIWMRRGNIAADGPVDQVVSRYEAVIPEEVLSAPRDDSQHAAAV